ncbi:hypothetical protein BJF78_13945 [Pseudonocardia sp. CNS-139]|nr:hypothetical protein BJF78_13945 [Pseudonocardia sp. CNS-139]
MHERVAADVRGGRDAARRRPDDGAGAVQRQVAEPVGQGGDGLVGGEQAELGEPVEVAGALRPSSAARSNGATVRIGRAGWSAPSGSVGSACGTAVPASAAASGPAPNPAADTTPVAVTASGATSGRTATGASAGALMRPSRTS